MRTSIDLPAQGRELWGEDIISSPGHEQKTTFLSDVTLGALQRIHQELDRQA